MAAAFLKSACSAQQQGTRFLGDRGHQSRSWTVSLSHLGRVVDWGGDGPSFIRDSFAASTEH